MANPGKVDMLITDQAVENTVLQDGGTIHLYLSKANASALANHTDTTDIFVLHLHGEKEWIICAEEENHKEKTTRSFLEEKLDKCATYDHAEMDQLRSCKKHILYPGDTLSIPRRTIHSARASKTGLSAHLTFGLANDSAAPDDNQCTTAVEGSIWMERALQSIGLCNQAQGGLNCDTSCNLGCDTACNRNCNSLCNCQCDSSNGRSSCDGCCNGSCDSGCNGNCNLGCQSGCNICPNTGSNVSPRPPSSTPPPIPPPPPPPPPPRPPPPPPPPICNSIRIEKACEGLDTNVVEAIFTRFPDSDSYPCQNDNRIDNTSIYYRPTTNSSHILYYGKAASENSTRWMIADRSVYCANSAGRMAQFAASKTYPHLRLPDVPEIFCSDRVIGPGSGLVLTPLEISCLDPVPTPGPTRSPIPPPPPTSPTQIEGGGAILSSSAAPCLTQGLCTIVAGTLLLWATNL